MQAIIDAVPMNMAVLDFTGRITSVNEAWRNFAEANGDPGLAHTGPGQNYLTAIRSGLTGNPAQDASTLEFDTALSSLLRGEQSSFDQVYPCHSPDQRRWYCMHAAPLKADGGGALVTHYNVTRWMSDQPEHANETPNPSAG